MTPSNAAAALAAVEILEREPERVRRLNDRSALFLRLARGESANLSQLDIFRANPKEKGPVDQGLHVWVSL